mmetsp:Transcript_3055/g.5418  ORF Transcript_3055/g.5418 Transcript_3055/m.5418 type:complete len:230 (+) Transcript_3055:293-982(+)
MISRHELSVSCPPRNETTSLGDSSSTIVAINSRKVARCSFLAFLDMWCPDSTDNSATLCFTSSMSTSHSVPSHDPCLYLRSVVFSPSSSLIPKFSLASWMRATHSPPALRSSTLEWFRHSCKSGKMTMPLPLSSAPPNSSPAMYASATVVESNAQQSSAIARSVGFTSSPRNLAAHAASQRSRTELVADMSVPHMKCAIERALRAAPRTIDARPVALTAFRSCSSIASQ